MEKGKRVPVKAVAAGTAAALGAYLLLLALTAYLTVSGRLGEEQTARVVFACGTLAALLGALTASWGKRGSTGVKAGAAGAFAAAVLLIGFLAGEGISPHGAAGLLASALLGALLSLLLTRHGKGRHGRRRRGTNARR